MIITRHVCIPRSLEFTGMVRAEILDAVAEHGPHEHEYDVEIISFTPGRPATRFDPPEDAEFEHNAHDATVASDILALLLVRHGDIIQLSDCPAILGSIEAYEGKWIDEELTAEVFEAKAAEDDYYECCRAEQERW